MCIVVSSIPGNDVCISASLLLHPSCACLRTREKSQIRNPERSCLPQKKIPLPEFGISPTCSPAYRSPVPPTALPAPPNPASLLLQLFLCILEDNFGLREVHTISLNQTFLCLSSLINQGLHVSCVSFIPVGFSYTNGQD